mgnify:CR=1 FL=1
MEGGPIGKPFKPAKYMMITGQKLLTTKKERERGLLAVTNDDNINGDNIKVIIVSRAGSEGMDFKNIRQMHILDPWYNLNRTNQTIGRAVRNLSHCMLPFKERNVEIFLVRASNSFLSRCSPRFCVKRRGNSGSGLKRHCVKSLRGGLR